MRLKITPFLFFISLVWASCSAQETQLEPKSNLNYIVNEGGSNSNLLVLIHGYGSNEKDLFSFKNKFPNTTVVCVRGPKKMSAKSYSWYDMEFKPDGNHRRNLNQALQSETMLLQFISAIEDKYKTDKTIVGGFSQGAIMSAQIALSHPESVDGIICISGMLLSEYLAPLSKFNNQYKLIKAFYGHGTIDNVLTIDKGRRCSAIIKKSGMQLTSKEYPIKHQISPQEIGDIEKWYNDNFIRN
jgi:phospholipase/carboxylesterase